MDIGDIVIYNGNVIEKEGGVFVWKQLYNHMDKGNSYKIEDIMSLNGNTYYLLKFPKSTVWYPEEVFYTINTKEGVSKKYGFR